MVGKEVNLALIGCGYWGKNYISTANALEEINLAYICDSNEGNLAKFRGKKLLRKTRFVADYREILEDGKVDGIIIATPASTHVEIARRVLENGFDVLVEKPLTTNVRDAEELCEIADAHEKVLMVGHIFEYNPAFRYIKGKIKEGEFGDITTIHSKRVNLGPVRNDVGALEDLATHDIHMLNSLVGKSPDKVNCVGHPSNKPSEGVVSLNLTYSNKGVLSTIYAAWNFAEKERRVEIVGTKKQIIFDDIKPTDKVVIYERGIDCQPEEGGYGGHIVAIRDGDILIPKIKWEEPLKAEIRHFVGCIRGEVKCETDGRVGLETVRVLAAAKKSMVDGGAEVRVS